MPVDQQIVTQNKKTAENKTHAEKKTTRLELVVEVVT